MKIVIKKGMPLEYVEKILKDVLKHQEADSIGNITMLFDVYKDGEKIVHPDGEVKLTYNIEQT